MVCLNLENNNMNALSAEHFRACFHIAWLNVKNNRISSVEQAAFKDTKIVILDLSHNDLWNSSELGLALHGLTGKLSVLLSITIASVPYQPTCSANLMD